ncbi:MAG: efflux RND transporter periplasmic adaptor subunit [Candidatus Eiseniibacteriota bacterium]|nr:MAG: efflux RND transporter periplasmic adaptor subunit [Candidatus Eisenbacteria bacterium]
MSRKRKIILIVGGVAAVVLLIVLGNMGRSSDKGLKIQAADVSVGSITSTVRAPGSIRPEKEVQISASVPAEIVNLAVKEGDPVEQGQLLLQLDKSEYLAQVEQRRATLRTAEASHRLAVASLKQIRSVYERKKALSERGLASDEELEAARTQYDVQEAEVEAAAERIAEARAALNIAEDNLSKTTFVAPQSGVVSELNVEEGEIVVVGTMNVPGTVIMTVADLAHMQVECAVDETDVVSVRKGQKAKIFVDAFPDTVFEATVVEIGSSGKRASAGAEGTATDFEVKLTLEPGIENLKPGMTADAEIETATHTDALKVPIQAIVVREKKTVEKWISERDKDKKLGKKRDGTKQKTAGEEPDSAADETTDVEAGAGEKPEAEAADSVSTAEEEKVEEITGIFTVEEEKAKFVPVKTGIMSETEVEILEGLSEEDRVVTGPFRVLRDLKDGQRIREEKKEKKGEGEGRDEESD